MAEVEETLKRIQAHKGVIATMVINAEGNVLTFLYVTNWAVAMSVVTLKHKIARYEEEGKISCQVSFDCDSEDYKPKANLFTEITLQKPGFSGIPIRTTLDNSTTVHYAGLLHQLTAKARSTVRDIDPQNDLTFLRIRSKKHEIMIAPDKEYLLIVIQNPCE